MPNNKRIRVSSLSSSAAAAAQLPDALSDPNDPSPKNIILDTMSDLSTNKQLSSSSSQQGQLLSLADVFSALFTTPFTGKAKEAVLLLSGKATHIASKSANADQCLLYLRATALHVDHLLEVLLSAEHDAFNAQNGINNFVNESGRPEMVTEEIGQEAEQRLVADIVQAAGCAVTQCRRRSDISKSGIIPVLARLALSCQLNNNNVPSELIPYTPNSNTSSSYININAHVLTAANTELLQACISAGHYLYACQFTDRHPVLYVLPYKAKSYITVEQYLRYFYLLGIARIGMRRYQDAKLAFEVGLEIPCLALSAVTIACRKKHLLVQCLLSEEGKDMNLFDSNASSSGNYDESILMHSSESSTTKTGNRSGVSSGNSQNRKGAIGTGQIQNQSGNATLGASKPKTLKDKVTAIPNCVSPSVTHHFDLAKSSSSNSGDISATEYFHPHSHSLTNDNQPSMVDQYQQQYGLSVYYQLVDAFAADDMERFEKHKIASESLLKTDGNWGLINQVQEEMNLPRKLHKIARLYEVIPLTKLANKLGLSSPEEAETLMRQMIMEQNNMNEDNSITDINGKAIFEAQIDQEEGVVHFPLDDQSVNEFAQKQQQKDLISQLKHCMELFERIQNLDISMTTSQRYNAVFKYRSTGSGNNVINSVRSEGGGYPGGNIREGVPSRM